MRGTWFEKNVLVTGATGFLGPWVVEELIGKEANVTILMRDFVPESIVFEKSLHRKANIVHGDFEDYWTVERAMNEYEIEIVFHLGAQAVVLAANRSPMATFKANIMGTVNVLEAARNSELVRKVVLASSDKAYGEQKKLPYTEEAPLQGRHPYDVSKSCADLIAQSYYHTYGLPVAIARCGNLYGPGDLNFNRIIPGTIRSVIFGERPVIRSDGTYIRDYFYVKDAAGAYITLAEKMDEKKLFGEAFNFSTGNRISVLELVGKILKEMKSDLKPIVKNEAKSEIKSQYLSSEKAKKVLGWEAGYSIEDGLRETIPWYVSHFKKKR